jgi:REP element-mobilizing transposase RayT
MPNTYTQLMFHVVFSTKNRQRTLPDGQRELLYRYIRGIHKNLNCHMYRIGGIDDHVHILTAIPTTLSLADYVKEVKTGSSPRVALRSTRGYSKVTATRSHSLPSSYPPQAPKYTPFAVSALARTASFSPCPSSAYRGVCSYGTRRRHRSSRPFGQPRIGEMLQVVKVFVAAGGLLQFEEPAQGNKS